MLTPEEWHSIKFFATAKNILSCYLPLAPGNHPVLDANSLAGVRLDEFSIAESSLHVLERCRFSRGPRLEVGNIRASGDVSGQTPRRAAMIG